MTIAALRQDALQTKDVCADKKGVQEHARSAGTGEDQRLPNQLVWCVVALCALPSILSFGGVSFGLPDYAPDLGALSRLAPAAKTAGAKSGK